LRDGGRVRYGERGNGIAGEREERRCEVGDARLQEMKKSVERDETQMKKKNKERQREREKTTSRAIAAQFVQLTFIMSPSGGADRTGKRSRA